MIEFTATVEMLDSSVYGHHLHVPNELMAEYQYTDRRMVCLLNDLTEIHCALMPKGNGDFMILLHKHLRNKLGISLGDKVNVKMAKDESEYGMPLPDELTELWEIDPDAYKVFHTLTKGKQRSIIYLIGKGIRSETRAKKAVAILEYLKTVNGNLDFREMNQFIKNYNSL